MATRTGYRAASPIASAATPAITIDLQQYAGLGWPGFVDAASTLAGGMRVASYPVASLTGARTGWKTHAYTDDFYYRVHLNPARLELGNVVSAQAIEVRVWNAWLAPQTVTALSGLEAGLSVDAPSAFPLTVRPLQESVWLVRVTPDGPSVIDASIEWLFEAVASPRLRITGARIVAWPFVPDWSEPVLERLTWATEVHRSRTGAEQRRALRIAPRRAFEARTIVQGRERALLDLSLAGWGSRPWALPIWPDVQLLASAVTLGASSIPCQTEGRDFRAGGLALLRGESAFEFEAVEIDAIAPGGLMLRRPTLGAWPSGTRLYPLRAARLTEQPSITRLNDQTVTAALSCELSEPADWPLVLPTTMYRGAPVFDLVPDETVNLSLGWQRLLESFDNTSSLPTITDTAGIGFPVQGHRWLLAGRTEQAAWRSLVYALRGMQRAVWVPTHADDLQLVATAAGGAIDVGNAGYARFGVNRPGRRDVRIARTDGQVLYRRITGATELSSQAERLTIDSDLPGPIAIGEVQRISFMALCRQDSDELEVRHTTDADGIAQSQTVWRALRDELELAA